MDTTDTRIGRRPPAGVKSGCARETGGKRCGHPKALHGKDAAACQAFACTAGPEGAPCPGFIEAREHQAA